MSNIARLLEISRDHAEFFDVKLLVALLRAAKIPGIQ